MIRQSLPASLHRPLLAAAVLIAAGTGLYLLSAEWLTHQQQTKARTQAQLQHMQAQLGAATSDAAHARQLNDQLAALEVVSVDARRPGVRDAEHLLQQDERLFSVRLIEERSSAMAPEHARLPLVRLRHLRLQAHLLHEGALNDALQALATIPGFRTIPLGCEITRLQQPALPRLSALCEFHWVSLHPRTQPAS